MNDYYEFIMGSPKSSKRSKWYKCIKPDAEDDNYPFKSISSLGKGGKERVLHDNNFMTTLDSSSDVDDLMDKKSKSSRNFSRVLKAVLFQSSLAKKKRSRKSGQETSSSRPSKIDKLFNSFRNNKKPSSSDKESLDESLRTDSIRSSLFSSSTTAAASSSSLSSSYASFTASERKRSSSFGMIKQLNQKPTIYSNKSNEYCRYSSVGLCFLLICLVGLIFVGKVFAIFCTSTCFFLIPCRFKRAFDCQSDVNDGNLDSIYIS